MADVYNKEIRSRVMSKIRSNDTKPELLVRKYLFAKGLRYRKNVKSLPGTPDIVFPKYKTVVFVNGCFWHKHDCGQFSLPKSNIEYWHKKLDANVLRDAHNKALLESQGWKVLTIWECELKRKNFEQNLDRLYRQIIS